MYYRLFDKMLFRKDQSEVSAGVPRYDRVDWIKLQFERRVKRVHIGDIRTQQVASTFTLDKLIELIRERFPKIDREL